MPATHTLIQHADIIALTSWMAVEGYTADEVAEAVRKPWNYTAEIAQAKAAQVTA